MDMGIRRMAAAVAGVLVVVLAAAPVHARPPGSPQYIDHTEWVFRGDRATLRIFPTAWGWAAAGPFSNGAQSYDAWAELLENTPDANTLSMQKQFFCYWQLASFTNPGKVGTWNLEPWRRVVSDMITQNSGCDPGGPEDFISGRAPDDQLTG